MSVGWIVLPVVLLYFLGLLFFIAWYGDHRQGWLEAWRPWIYSLSIAVYCTSWTFFGSIEQASNQLWSFLPIYIGPILVFTFGWRFLAHMILISKREHITSIAGFIAARYGKSQGLAATVTIITVIGILPYIALQLRGILMSLHVLAPGWLENTGFEQAEIAGLICVILALFTLLFGARHLDASEHHRGVMMAIAFSSVVKLAAFLLVGIFALSLFFGSSSSFVSSVSSVSPHQWNTDFQWRSFLIHTLVAMAAVICFPRQFHTLVVENQRIKDLHHARWIFPVYLILIALFVFPLTFAGHTFLPGISAESYILQLPLSTGNNTIALIVFLGGISAAIGMVIVSTIALSIMVSNDLVLPQIILRMRKPNRDFLQCSGFILNLRRGIICVLLLGAWAFYLFLIEVPSLSGLGFLSFAAIAQFAPSLVGGIYWRQANKKGVYIGLFAGFSVWLMILMMQANMLGENIFRPFVSWILTPPNVTFFNALTPLDWGIALSLILNCGLFFLVSILTQPPLKERLQAASFVGMPLPKADDTSLYQSRVTVAELEMLGARFVGDARMRQTFQTFSKRRGERLLPEDQAGEALIRHTERLFSGVLGASSAKLVLSSALLGRNMRLDDIVTIVDEASEVFDFNRGLLQGAIEHIGQGISVVDKQLRLVAWNRRYIDLFDYPPELIQAGRPIADVIRYNAKLGLCGLGDIDELVRKRVTFLRQGSAHVSSRLYPDGRVIEVQGKPMPGGGFVMTFTDISAFRNVEEALKQANETLEARVVERTQALGALNSRLINATEDAELASQSKSRLLAAVSHDLMQPLNAARLFASFLSTVANDHETKKISSHIESALGAAEDLIVDLLDISRIESGKMDAKIENFELDEVFSTLAAEFGMIASKQGVQFCVQPTKLRICSDKRLLRRVLQNFLTNAFRYNPKGRVLLGVRRKGKGCNIEVWDNGPGIHEDRQKDIFNEFTRLDIKNVEIGLGIGLAISRGISRILEQPLSLRSWLGKGSVFSIMAPCSSLTLECNGACLSSVSPLLDKAIINPPFIVDPLLGMQVLCVDNEPEILLGMENLLSRWGCNVHLAENLEMVVNQIDKGLVPDIILSDYHLDPTLTGLDVLQRCKELLGDRVFTGVIITADRSQETFFKIREQNFDYMSKPVKPLKLRALLQQVLA